MCPGSPGLSFFQMSTNSKPEIISLKEVRRLVTGPSFPLMNSIGVVLQPWDRRVLSNQLVEMKRQGQWSIMCSSDSSACLQSAQVVSLMVSIRWHLTLVGSSRWLKKNMVSLMLMFRRAAVSLQMEIQSR